MASNIPNTRAFPFSAVALVADTIGGVAGHGSGVLIAPDELLTAAHVVWHSSTGAASSLAVVQDLNGSDQPFGVVGVDRFHFFSVNDPGNILSPSGSQADFALLHLTQSLGAAGIMVPVANFGGGLVNVTGYPDLAGTTSMFNLSETSSSDPNLATLINSQDPGSGASGSPAWQMIGSAAQLYGVESTTTRIAELTGTTLSIINSWIAADHAGTSPLGAIAVAVPALLHSITTESAPAGVSAPEAALFDSFSYLNNNADVKAAGIDPLVHFSNYGWHEGRNPEPLFDVAFYLAHNPDVAGAGIDPLAHYANFGWHEGRDPSASFSTSHYLAVNADVRLAGLDPLQHYALYGVTEGRAL